MDHQDALESEQGLPMQSDNPMMLGDQPIGASLHPRLAWMMYYEETKSVQAVAEKFGISRKTFYKWYKRYKDSLGDSKSLTDRSRRPHRCPRATPESSIELLKHVKAGLGREGRAIRSGPRSRQSCRHAAVRTLRLGRGRIVARSQCAISSRD